MTSPRGRTHSLDDNSLIAAGRASTVVPVSSLAWIVLVSHPTGGQAMTELAPIFVNNERVRVQGDPSPKVSKIIVNCGKEPGQVEVFRLTSQQDMYGKRLSSTSSSTAPRKSTRCTCGSWSGREAVVLKPNPSAARREGSPRPEPRSRASLRPTRRRPRRAPDGLNLPRRVARRRGNPKPPNDKTSRIGRPRKRLRVGPGRRRPKRSPRNPEDFFSCPANVSWRRPRPKVCGTSDPSSPVWLG